MRKTLKTKLGKDFKNYIILGACNPPFAYKALSADDDIGLLLPCNVIISEMNQGIKVAAIKPTVAMSFADNEGLHEFAKKVEEKLQAAISSL